GIRGTEFISYETDQTAVALDEGSLNLQTLGNTFDLSDAGAQSQAAEFVLDEKRMVTFEGNTATVTGFTPAVLADFAAFKVFGGDLLGDFSIDFTPGQTAGAAGAAGATTVAAATKEEEKPDKEKQAEADDDSAFGQFYIGAGVGISQSDTDSGKLQSDLEGAGNTVTSVNYEAEDQAGKVFAGYYFTRHFGVEVGYSDLGEFKSTIDATGSTLVNDVATLHPVSPAGVYAAGVLRVNLLIVSLIAKGGVYAWEGDVMATLPGGVQSDAKRDGTDGMFGLGLDLPIVPIRIEAEHYDVDGGVNVLFANLVFHF
ncbi:MAG: outer membrane beta-barrel protein, partial [Gammaproteobacteria bacterium]|nr:outer membrane beta-barrel protein [Gammaproteobacteria bacterium]